MNSQKRQSDLPAWQPLYYLRGSAKSLLDIGCNVGALLQMAQEQGIPKLSGIEINRHAVNTAKERLPDFAASICHGSADELPWKNNSFDAITMSEVLEHIPSRLRPSVFKEIDRVLKPGGRLIITVPYRGFFHWLDPANIRFYFPKLYSIVSGFVKGFDRKDGFEGEKHGVVWHHHFRYSELEELIPKDYKITEKRFRGIIIAPLSQYLMFPFYRLQCLNNPIYKMIRRAKELELKINPPGFLGFNILLVIEKP
jgi:SAM-dependent methyltransferase